MRSIAIPTSCGTVEYIPLDDVTRLQHEMKYVTVATPKKEYLLANTSIGSLDRLYKDRFVRISRSMLLPMRDIKAVSSHSLDYVAVMKNGDEFQISRRRFKAVKEKLSAFHR